MFINNAWNTETVINNTLLEIFEKEKDHNYIKNILQASSNCNKRRFFRDEFLIAQTSNSSKIYEKRFVKKNIKKKFDELKIIKNTNFDTVIKNQDSKYNNLDLKCKNLDLKSKNTCTMGTSFSTIGKNPDAKSKIPNSESINLSIMSKSHDSKSNNHDFKRQKLSKMHKNLDSPCNRKFLNYLTPNTDKLNQGILSSNINHAINFDNGLEKFGNEHKSLELKISDEINESTKVGLIPKSPDSNSKNLHGKMLARLIAGRFRYLNEQIAEKNSYEMLDDFVKDKECFKAYHEGFKQQVSKWNSNPVDLVISYIRNRDSNLVVADMGCGDAKIASSIKNKVYSFDLAALNRQVIVSDMANVPLKSGIIDICVYCLSLMGKNLDEILCEGNRVMKLKGTLLIIEVKSRFTKYGEFVKKLNKIGFKLINMDKTNKMFIWFEFRKFRTVDFKNFPGLAGLLKPSIYCKR